MSDDIKLETALADRRVLLKMLRGEPLEGAHDFAGCSPEVLEVLRTVPPGAVKARRFVSELLGGLADGLEQVRKVANKAPPNQHNPGPRTAPRRHERRRRQK